MYAFKYLHSHDKPLASAVPEPLSFSLSDSNVRSIKGRLELRLLPVMSLMWKVSNGNQSHNKDTKTVKRLIHCILRSHRSYFHFHDGESVSEMEFEAS